MTNFERYRSKHLCVPGGTVRGIEPATERCLCLARDVTDADVEYTKADENGSVWAYIYVCPVHGGRQIRPVTSHVFGTLTESPPTARTVSGKAKAEETV